MLSVMSTAMSTSPSKDFRDQFLANYLKFGLGSMPKSDVDALAMSLIDKFGFDESGPMAALGNQAASERLRTPVVKIKKLRYEAALKFGGEVEDQARGRLLAALANASIEPENDKICLIIEDTLAKNWLQGQLKQKQQIFDHPFNTEIIRVSSAGMFAVLESLFGAKDIEAFKSGYENAKVIKDVENRRKMFKAIALNFAKGAAKAAGAGVVAIVNSHLPLPL
jgi:hypothetical protein